MSRAPMFKLAPSGAEYLMTLAGVLLICGDVVYGDPSETTPEGRGRAKNLIDRVLTEATARGFRHAETVRALLRRNQPNARLKNLAQQAVDLIPKPFQAKIIGEIGRDTPTHVAQRAAMPAEVVAGRVDPRFWEAGNELQRIAERDGKDAMHRPEHAHLLVEMMRYAPEPLKSEMRAKIDELGLIPKATHVDDNGQAVYSAEQLAETHGVTVDEIHATIERAGILPEDLHTGAVYPLQ